MYREAGLPDIEQHGDAGFAAGLASSSGFEELRVPAPLSAVYDSVANQLLPWRQGPLIPHQNPAGRKCPAAHAGRRTAACVLCCDSLTRLKRAVAPLTFTVFLICLASAAGGRLTPTRAGP